MTFLASALGGLVFIAAVVAAAVAAIAVCYIVAHLAVGVIIWAEERLTEWL